jgi:hypothetical protein
VRPLIHHWGIVRSMKKTSIVALNGGLGNQLFQWFFAHTVSKSGSFRIDPLFEEVEKPLSVSRLELGPLFARCLHVDRDSKGLVNQIPFRKILHLANHMWGFSSLRPLLSLCGYYRENPNSEVAQSLSIPKPMRYAYGYFQNAQLMKQAEEAIQGELLPIIQANQKVIKLKFDLGNPYTVIHVRRYPTAGYKLTRIQFCNLSSRYFVEWARKNSGQRVILLTEFKDQVTDVIDLLNPDLVLDSSQTSAWDVLTIMAGADKCLGSNSSLSWWGVQLCSRFGGQVWLPSNWSYWDNVNTKAFHFEECNIAPSDWDPSGFD